MLLSHCALTCVSITYGPRLWDLLLAHAQLVFGLAFAYMTRCITTFCWWYFKQQKKMLYMGATHDCTSLILRQDFLKHYNLSLSLSVSSNN